MKCERCGEVNPAEIHTCTPEPQVNGWPLYSGLPKLMKPTQEQVIAWAREAGMEPTTWQLSFGYEACGTHEAFERLAALAYEAGRKDENEACAELCEYLPANEFVDRSEATIWDLATLDCAAAIRARREQ